MSSDSVPLGGAAAAVVGIPRHVPCVSATRPARQPLNVARDRCRRHPSPRSRSACQHVPVSRPLKGMFGGTDMLTGMPRSRSACQHVRASKTPRLSATSLVRPCVSATSPRRVPSARPARPGLGCRRYRHFGGMGEEGERPLPARGRGACAPTLARRVGDTEQTSATGPDQISRMRLACWRYGTREAIEMLAVCVVI